MVYTVPVSLTGAEKLALRVGMTANVEIKVADITDALLVPTIALQQSNGQYQVLVPTTADPNGATQAVTVEVGLSDGTYTQILKGLSVGDKVVEQVKSTTSDNDQQMGPGGPGGMDMGGGAPPAPPSGGASRPSGRSNVTGRGAERRARPFAELLQLSDAEPARRSLHPEATRQVSASQ